jgi:hypothetical protein
MSRNEIFVGKKKRVNALLWLFEPLESDPGYLRQRFFSFDAAYLDGRLCLALVDRKEPWSGMMVCTAREHHASLQVEFPQLTSHPVLGKWLYVSQRHAEFESVTPELVALAARRDPRLGIEPGKKRKRAAKKRATKARKTRKTVKKFRK